MSENRVDKVEEIPEYLTDPTAKRTYQRLRFFGKVSSILVIVFVMLKVALKLRKI